MPRGRSTIAAAAVTIGLLLSACGTADGSAGARAPERAQLAASGTVRVVAVGDIACPPGSRVTRRTCRQAATAKATRNLRPTRVIALGDLQYQKGRYRGFLRSYHKSWGTLRPITWPIPGNHEYFTPGARGYYRYFAGQQPGAPGWYRHELNGWQLYFLNSNCTKVDCDAELAWLDQQMTQHPSTCSLVAFHHPRFSSGEHGANRSMRRFWAVADEHGADIALSGHDHDYERFAPMDATGRRDADGIRQFISGGGGVGLRPRESSAANSERFLKRFGVLQLDLGATGYSWKFRTPALRVLDSGSSACR